MSATCFLLSVMISLAVFVFSPKPADTSDRCATSDQCHSKSIKTEHEHADKQHAPRSNQVDVQPSRKRGGNRAASPVPALTKKHPDSSLLFPGGTFEARSPIQVTFSLSFLLCTVATCIRLTCRAALLLRIYRVQPPIFALLLAASHR